MSEKKEITISLQLEVENGAILPVKIIKLDNQIFLPADTKALIEKIAGKDFLNTNLPLSTMGLLPEASKPLGPKKENSTLSFLSPPIKPGAEYNTLEEYGGNSFYRHFWGTLTYKQLNPSQSQVTYQGKESVFDQDFIGKWLEPSRIHKCSSEYPSTGRNYFPGALAVVYSRVIEVLNGHNLIVDFGYNGGSLSNPVSISDQDGIFFFDNKFSIEVWSRAANNKQLLKANSGQIYACMGMPQIVVKPESTLKFASEGTAENAAIHVMMSDAFNGDLHGRGLESPPSFVETFGGNENFFVLPDHGRVDIDFGWQFIPPTYSQKVVQYGSPNGVFFYDGSNESKQYGLKKVLNLDQFRIRNAMMQSLGFVRPGVSFSMPNQGYCNGGGIHDGREITKFCTYRFEGDWYSKDPNNIKARTSGGVRVEWIGRSKDELGNFIEMESLKAYRFDDLNFRFLSNQTLEVDDPDFTWYHLASQEWTGGTSTGSELTHLIINGYFVGLNTNGDFWLVNGDEDVAGRGISSHRVSLFDKIPAKGDVILQDLVDLKKNGLIGKVADNIFEIWGWSIQKGDQLSFNGIVYTVTAATRKFKNWSQFAEQYSSPPERLLKTDRRITYTEIELDKPIIQPLADVKFSVVKSALEQVLDGQAITGCSAIWDLGDNAPGHLMYTDYNINLFMKDVNIHGLIRSTSRPLWAETTKALSGRVSSIPVGYLGAAIWKAGDRLQLAYPETGLRQEIEVLVSFSGNAGNLLIKPVHLEVEFPEKSVVTALYSLNSEACFDYVNYVNEDLSPCYSERIDYRPQGLRLRQLLTEDKSKRVKIIGGRLSWYSNLDNRFEPEVELTEKPHMVNTKSVVNVLLNPVITDGKGAYFGYQYKKGKEEEIFILTRIIAKNGRSIDLSNSILGSDVYLEGEGKFILDNVSTANYIDNGKDTGVGFNLVVEDKYTSSSDLILVGKAGRAAVMVKKDYPIGVLKIDFSDWTLVPGLFNSTGFFTRQNKTNPSYTKFIKITD